MADPDFWNNQESAQKLISATNKLKEKRDHFNDLAQAFSDEEAALELLKEESDTDLQAEVESDLESLKAVSYTHLTLPTICSV